MWIEQAPVNKEVQFFKTFFTATNSGLWARAGDAAANLISWSRIKMERLHKTGQQDTGIVEMFGRNCSQWTTKESDEISKALYHLGLSLHKVKYFEKGVM